MSNTRTNHPAVRSTPDKIYRGAPALRQQTLPQSKGADKCGGQVCYSHGIIGGFTSIAVKPASLSLPDASVFRSLLENRSPCCAITCVRHVLHGIGSDCRHVRYSSDSGRISTGIVSWASSAQREICLRQWVQFGFGARLVTTPEPAVTPDTGHRYLHSTITDVGTRNSRYNVVG
ncbi:hypothetical protein VFPPC_15411 [Pochonia chlamydosporia 170]|uniref:Uncharacterized protein n=1 Tax=Pochonia chlamydosporia 170 TaxID=1380566 RepID=A0A179G8E8_METCM|nr:hypothetical protein VFPPC_15411 [Pochonia chlamydosporia 170]OAQ74077.1 hypothetical protein VFPPC_15411 [Pochonia chlamydosporia 170]